MRIYKGFDRPIDLKCPMAAVGSFDGVHLGHVRILQYVHRLARENRGESVVVTFSPHPQQVLRPGSDFFLINTLDENLRLIERQGIDAAVVIPFTEDFSRLSYTDFLDDYLIGRIHVRAIVMGPDHAFGHNREGRLKSIGEECAARGVKAYGIPELMVHECGVRSAKIRKLIQEGNWPETDALLGYAYSKSRKTTEK